MRLVHPADKGKEPPIDEDHQAVALDADGLYALLDEELALARKGVAK